MIKDFLDLIKDYEIDASDSLDRSLSYDRVHQSINLSLKLLWCTCNLYTGHLHNDAKGKKVKNPPQRGAGLAL